jgi:outer membrane protein assembly factor BamD (BamD/ComL family)
MIELADYYYRRRELAQARDVYDAYLESFPAGPNALRAAERRIQCDVGRFKGPRYNAAPLIDAKVQIRQFQRRHPAEADATGLNAALASRLDESQAAQLLDTAEWYLRVGDRPSARLVLARLVRDHPRSLAAERAGAMLEREGWAVQASAPADPSAEPDPAASSAPPEPSP